jgi:hypothetical protein
MPLTFYRSHITMDTSDERMHGVEVRSEASTEQADALQQTEALQKRPRNRKATPEDLADPVILAKISWWTLSMPGVGADKRVEAAKADLRFYETAKGN